jgi:hypothetical protein
MKTIRTERLRLEPVRPENSAVLWEVLQAPGLRDFQDLPSIDATQFRRTVASRPPALTPKAVGRFEWLIYFETPAERRERTARARCRDRGSCRHLDRGVRNRTASYGESLLRARQRCVTASARAERVRG